MHINDSTHEFVKAQDAALNKRAGWNENALASHLHDLLLHGRVEIGWREACGKTDPTHHKYRAWLKVLKRLRKDGMTIAETAKKHGNGYATMKGGFWSSIVYTIQP